MKKAFSTNKLSNPTNILRRVLSKTSNTSKTSAVKNRSSSTKPKTPVEKNSQAGRMDARETRPTINVEAELLLLKQQVGSLQQAVSSMQNDTEKKEVAIANLAREKERLAVDLRKQQRTNSTLKQQLDEEREFYYKEKEIYCQEMNDCKKLKKTLKVGDYKAQIDHYKREITKLKDTLTQTLEANYNLSVKFLRMKNTKYCIKNRLRKLEALHDNTVTEFTSQIEHLKAELVDIVERQLQIPIPPSNKKYLQIVKQNSTLAHENLCLQLELDRANLELDKHRMLQIQNETNSKLRYINHKTKSDPQMESTRHSPRQEKKESKSEQQLKTKEKEQSERHETVAFQVTEEKPERKKRRSARESKVYNKESSRMDSTARCSEMTIATQITTISEEPPERDTDFELLRLQLMERPSETFTQTSDCTHDSYDAVRTQSAPEIVQTSLFVNDTRV